MTSEEKERGIRELAEGIRIEALNYNHPNSPVFVFLTVLAAYQRVEDHGGCLAVVPDSWPLEPFLGDREMQLLVGWFSRAWDLCDHSEDFQLLYDGILGEPEDGGIPPLSGGELDIPDWVGQILASPDKEEAREQTRERTQVEPAMGENASNAPSGGASVPEAAPDADQLPPTLEEVEAEDVAEDNQVMSEGDAAESPDGSPPVLEGPHPRVTLEAWFDARLLKEFFGRIRVLVDDCKVLVDGEGLHVTAVDPTHVAMVDTHLPWTSSEFHRFAWEVPPEGGEPLPDEVEFGIDLDKVMEALKPAKDRVVFRYVGNIDRGGIEVSSRGAVWTMAAVDTTGTPEVRVPNLNLSSEFRIPGRELYEALKGCEAVSDHVVLNVDHQGDPGCPMGFRFVVRAEADVDGFRRVFQVEVTYVNNDGEQHRSLFPLDYLMGFIKRVKDEELRIHIGTDFPMRVDWDGATRGTWLLAPRVEA